VAGGGRGIVGASRVNSLSPFEEIFSTPMRSRKTIAINVIISMFSLNAHRIRVIRNSMRSSS
jgi:hypothetical protein